jgi:bacterioferritin
MRGDPKVVEALNDVLTAELTAVNQYFVHHKMCENWGYARLAKKKRDESIDEMKDADAVIARILYLEGVPNMQRLNPVRVGEDPIEQHRLDLALETEAIRRLNSAVKL